MNYFTFIKLLPTLLLLLISLLYIFFNFFFKKKKYRPEKELDKTHAGPDKKNRPKDVFGRPLPTEQEFEVLKNAPRYFTSFTLFCVKILKQSLHDSMTYRVSFSKPKQLPFSLYFHFHLFPISNDQT
jgi:hypothetical protein